MKHYYQNIEGFFTWEGLYAEAIKNAKPRAVFVEVGLLKGKSFAYLMTEAAIQRKTISAYAVDNFKALMGWKWEEDIRATFERNLKPFEGKYKLMPYDSVAAAAIFSYNCIDFLFIDASHDYDSVKRDINAFLPKMKPGSVMAGHDYTDEWPGLKQAVGECFGNRVEVVGDCWRVKL